MGFQSGGGGGRSFDAANKLYVGNLSWGVDDSALESLFGEQGRVMDARVVYDRESGRSRGFGFVTYSTSEEANNAISTLDGSVSLIHLSPMYFGILRLATSWATMLFHSLINFLLCRTWMAG